MIINANLKPHSTTYETKINIICHIKAVLTSGWAGGWNVWSLVQIVSLFSCSSSDKKSAKYVTPYAYFDQHRNVSGQKNEDLLKMA